MVAVEEMVVATERGGGSADLPVITIVNRFKTYDYGASIRDRILPHIPQTIWGRQ